MKDFLEWLEYVGVCTSITLIILGAFGLFGSFVAWQIPTDWIYYRLWVATAIVIGVIVGAGAYTEEN